jgi:hypothetical protein
MDTYTRSNYYLYALKTGLIDEANDAIRFLLMRTGFVFDKTAHSLLKNIKADTTGAQTISVVAATRTFTGAGGIFGAGGFIDKGFIENNQITVSGLGAADGVYTVESVPSETELIVVEAIAGAANVAGDGDEQIVAEDELEEAHGYLKNTMAAGGLAVAINNTYNRVDTTFDDVDWLATSDSIGPTPGAIVYNHTAGVIMGYLEFSAEKTAPNAEHLILANGTLRAE